jgi:hypothetical protein
MTSIGGGGIDRYWKDVKDVVKTAFKNDLLDEMKIPDDKKALLIEKDRKVGTIALTSFRGCGSLQDFRDIASLNVSIIREAAKILKKEQTAELYPGTATLVQVARDRFEYNVGKQLEAYISGRSGTEGVFSELQNYDPKIALQLKKMNNAAIHQVASILQGANIEEARYHPGTKDLLDLANKKSAENISKMADKLVAYATRLEHVYTRVEEDIKIEMRLKGRHMLKQEWSSNVNIALQQLMNAPSSSFVKYNIINEIKDLFKNGKVELSNLGGEKIVIPPYTGNTNKEFIKYLMTHVCTNILEGMHPQLSEGELYQTPGTGKILDSLKDIYAELTGSDPEKSAETKFADWLDTLSKDNSPEAKTLIFFLTSLSDKVSDASQRNLTQTIGVVDVDGKAELQHLDRTYNLRLNPKEPEIFCHDTFRLVKPSKGTQIELSTSLTPSLAGHQILAKHEISIAGLEFDPEFEQVHHVINLTGHECKIEDQEEPFDNSLHKKLEVEGSDLAPLSRPKPGHTPVEHVQILEGKGMYYVGIITPDKLVKRSGEQVIRQLKIQPKMLIPPTQSHTTLVPPTPNIKLETSFKELSTTQPALADLKLSIQYDTVSISKQGNVNLKGHSEKYEETSQKLAKAVGAEANTRGIHSKIGMLPKDYVVKLFEDPASYGLTLGEDGRLYLKLETPLSMDVEIHNDPFPPQQQILMMQLKAGGIEPEKALQSKLEFQQRKSNVELHQKEVIKKGDQFTFKGNPIPYKARHLVLATKGKAKVGRIPLTFSSQRDGVQLWTQFNQEVQDLFKSFGIKDAKVQILGSTIHGFTRNPTKELKPWRPDSDADLAIFSRTLAEQCAKENILVNPKIKMFGKYTVFKNEADAEHPGKGFHDLEIGKALAKLQEKWSLLLFGEEYPPDHVDFKMNISSVPFVDAIDLRATPKSNVSSPKEEK